MAAAAGGDRKRKPSAPIVKNGASSGSSTAVVTLADKDVLDCGICFLPRSGLPVFQCLMGHVVCSSCRDKLKHAHRYHVCRVLLADGGYQRCLAMDAVVDAARSPCPHAPYGRDATPARPTSWTTARTHRATAPAPPRAASSAPSRSSWTTSPARTTSPTTGPAASSVVVHQPQYSADFGCSFDARLRDGLNLVASAAADEHGRKYLFLGHVLRRASDRSVSVVCVRPRQPRAAKQIKFALTQRAEFEVEFSDLSDGLPDPNESYQLVVPKAKSSRRDQRTDQSTVLHCSAL